MKEWHEVFSRKLAAFEELKGNPILHSYAATAHTLLELIGFENSEKGSWSEGEVAERCHLMRAALDCQKAALKRSEQRTINAQKFAEDWKRWHEDEVSARREAVKRSEAKRAAQAPVERLAALEQSRAMLLAEVAEIQKRIDGIANAGNVTMPWPAPIGYEPPAVVTTELGPSPACDCGGPPNHVAGGILCRRET